MDWVPVVSQAKSLVQTVSGDIEGAKQTQRNFTNTFPVVSQVKSIGLFLRGNSQKAKDVQKIFLRSTGRFINETLNSTPLVGHVKGAVHYAMGDRERGREAIDSASHVSGAIIGGTGGFLVGGPTGAFLGGVIGANAVDLALTASVSVRKGEFEPRGRIQVISNIAKGNIESKSGETFDLAMGFILDGFTGQIGGVQKHAQIHKGHLTNYQPGQIAQNATKIETIKQVNAENIQKSTFRLRGLRGLFKKEKLSSSDEEEEEEISSFESYQRQTQVPESPCSCDMEKFLIDSDQIRFSQSPLEGYSPQAQIIIYQHIQDMAENGWAGEPINVVRMLNGDVIAFDNRKLYCAMEAGIEAPLHLREYYEVLPVSVRLTFEDENIKTWGDAIHYNIEKDLLHSPVYENMIPIG